MPDPKPGILRNLRIKRVSLVDNGANLDTATGDGAHIVLFKRETKKDGPNLGQVHVDSPAWDADDADEYEKADLSAEGRRGLPDSSFAAVWTDAQGKKHRKLPIHDAGHLTAARGRIDQADIPADVKAAARRRIDAKSGKSETKKEIKVTKNFLTKLLGLVVESDVEKRKAAAAELEKAMDGEVVEKVEHDPNNPDCKCADCMAKAEKRATPPADVAKRLADIEKVNTEMAKANATLVKANADLMAAIEVEKNTRLDNEMTTILKSFKMTPFDLTKDVAEFRKMKESNPTAFERTMALLKATDAQLIANNQLMRTFGSARTGSGSAWDQIEAKAAALVEKSTDGNMTIEKARDKVMLAHPELVSQYRQEQQ